MTPNIDKEFSRASSIKSTIYSDDLDAPAQNFCNEFIFGKYNDRSKILEFAGKVDESLRFMKGHKGLYLNDYGSY